MLHDKIIWSQPVNIIIATYTQLQYYKFRHFISIWIKTIEKKSSTGNIKASYKKIEKYFYNVACIIEWSIFDVWINISNFVELLILQS